MLKRRVSSVAAALALVFVASAASASTYTQTRYPIVLAHGMAGFDELFGVYEYWFGMARALRSGGADVHVTHVSAFSSTEARGEQLLAQVQDIVAVTGQAKVHLIGHSHGGLDVRYVAAARPDLVASVTTIGSPHKGAELADFLRRNVDEGGFTEGVLSHFANSLGTVLGLLAGSSNPQDAVAGLESLTAQGAADFNARYPAGVPASRCGDGAHVVNGIRYFSWTGRRVFTNALDPSDYGLALASVFYSGDNDGLVGRCSAHLGDVLRDDYRMNHLDEVNQILGIRHWFETSPKAVLRAHANRLKNLGL